MIIYFSHGKLGTPDGIKIRRLTKVAQKQGHSVRIPPFTDTLDPEVRAKRLSNILKNDVDRKILVGTSMGGYASLVAAETIPVKGIFLLAPALYLDGYKVQKFTPRAEFIEIVHGWNDMTVPLENSIRFAKRHRAALHILDSDHKLHSALEIVAGLFELFLASHF